MLWSTCSRMLPTTYTPQHIPSCPQCTIHLMLWVHVVDNTYLCCGAHVHECCPQHVPHNISLVVHNIPFTLCCGCMLWVTLTYVVEHMFMNVVHNIYLLSTTYGMLWRTFAVFPFVTHNIHPQYIKSSTTYIHNIWSLICCGCML